MTSTYNRHGTSRKRVVPSANSRSFRNRVAAAVALAAVGAGAAFGLASLESTGSDQGVVLVAQINGNPAAARYSDAASPAENPKGGTTTIGVAFSSRSMPQGVGGGKLCMYRRNFPKKCFRPLPPDLPPFPAPATVGLP